MSIKMTILYLILMIVFFSFAQAILSNVPPPPTRPEVFHTKEELRRYLQKLHEYHLILGRWRSRRSHDEISSVFDASDNINDLFPNEFFRRLKFRQEKRFQH
ncbi:hypothetical protein I4U23_008909 [Adineta vaga]|nr:hypothetical protein I4U23_008909 [Adineta vaga]